MTLDIANVHLIDHPLVQHKLTLMRRKDASTTTFRTLLSELSMLMAYEVKIGRASCRERVSIDV